MPHTSQADGRLRPLLVCAAAALVTTFACELDAGAWALRPSRPQGEKVIIEGYVSYTPSRAAVQGAVVTLTTERCVFSPSVTCTPFSSQAAATGPEGFYHFEVDRACDLVHQLVARSPEIVDGRPLQPRTGSVSGCGRGTIELDLPIPLPLGAIRENPNAGPRRCESVGQPVNVTDGNMYLQQTDYRLRGAGPSLDLTRTYNSSSNQTGLFGRGWSTRYDEFVRAYDPTRLLLQLPSGRALFFSRASGAQVFTPETQHDFRAQINEEPDGTYTLTTKGGGLRRFNRAGRLTSVADRNGNSTTLAYGPDGFLASVADSSGGVLHVRTDSAGRVVSLSDTLGPVASYAYGPGQQLLSVTYPDDSQYAFEYAVVRDRYLVTAVRDRLGNLLEAHAYDADGRATTSERHGGVERYTLAYAGPSETRVTDALGRVTRYFFDASRPTRVLTRVEGHCACGTSRAESWTYDAELNVTSRTDALGRSAAYAYDAAGNLLSSTDALGHTSRFTYDGFGRMLTATDPLGGVTRFDYDARGNLLGVTDAEGGVTSFAYDARGLPTAVTDPRGRVAARLTYDARGMPTARADALGNASTFAYDARGRLSGAADALGRATLYEYDPAGRLLTVTRPDGTTVNFAYDLAGRRTRATDPRGHSTHFEYDGAYRLTRVTDALGNTYGFAYDPMSNLTAVTDPLGRTTDYAYDDFDRPVRVTYPEAAPGAARLEELFNYDAAGRLTRHADPAGRTTLYDYDEAGRLTKVTDASGGETRLAYDARAQVVSLTDAAGQRHEFAYDRAGRATEVRRGALSALFAYDPAGNRVGRRDFGGALTTYQYDDAGRLTGTAYPDGTGSAYAYDALSRLTAATNETGTVSFSYDASGRVRSATDALGRVVSYAYDAAGNRTRMSLGLSVVAVYEYDALSRLTRLTDRTGGAHAYAYDAAGRLTSRSAPNGTTASYTYDGLGRLTRLRHARGAAPLADYQYSHDAAGRVTRIDDESGTHLYVYDAAGRLTSAAHPGREAEAYAYDSVGNRTSSHVAARYSYQPFNRLTAAGADTYAYDANGNLLEAAEESGTRSFTWDFENRLTSVSGAGAFVAYEYDALGRRTRRVKSGRGKIKPGRKSAPSRRDETKDFTYDGDDVLLDLNGDGTSVEYLGGPGLDDQLWLRTGAGRQLFFLADHLGTTRALLDAAGDTVERREYDSFGAAPNESGGAHGPKRRAAAPPLTRYGFTGREHDPDAGLIYYRARWYDPRLGRFISEDPLGLAGGINQYAYVSNDPLNKTDPLGLYEADVHYDLTYFLARNNPCFTDQEAREIAHATQDVDEQPDTWPALGTTWRQQWQNSYYHALHPGSSAGRPSPFLWSAALKESESGNHRALGQHLHYLQDTYSHEGYIDSIVGHTQGSHSVDKTASDVPKALEMAYATWFHLNAYAKQKKCCQSVWQPLWGEMVRRFAEVETNYPGGSSIDSKGEYTNLFLPDDPAARIRKRAFLGIPPPR